MNLILVGPQGSGKGTQAEFLTKDLNIPTFSVGQALRSNIKNETDLGKKVKKYVEAGELVPNELTNELVKQELQKKEYVNGVLLDGYPRDLEQVKFLEKNRDINYLLVLEIPEEETIKRLSGRRVCPKCGENYHVEYKRPKKDMICDHDGESLTQREDDNPQSIKERLNIYHSQTEPIIDYFSKQGKVIKIDGKGSINEVYQKIKNALKEKGLI